MRSSQGLHSASEELLSRCSSVVDLSEISKLINVDVTVLISTQCSYQFCKQLSLSSQNWFV